MSESIGGRIEIIGHAIATLTEAMKATDDVLTKDQSTIGRELHHKAVIRIADQINMLAESQVMLSKMFEAALNSK